MAQSPAHKFGQIIGDVLERAIEPTLEEFARREGLYLDRTGIRPARRGRKVSWTDGFGNSHDLDFVLERGGTPERRGTPAAFIETAWRRYTKHSRNKAQEIQGAILPLRDTYKGSAPFIGAVWAGVFTGGALEQLRSNGFGLVYFTYETVVEGFGAVGVDAAYTEQTSEAEFRRKIRAWTRLSRRRQAGVAHRLVELNRAGVQEFMDALQRSVRRRIECVVVLPLHGTATQWPSVEDAIRFVQSYRDEDSAANPVVRYEVQIRYSNGDCITGEFGGKEDAAQFLQGYVGS